MSGKLAPVLHGVDLCLTETRRLAARGPHFQIVHRLRVPGTDCVPGEEVAWVLLKYHRQEGALRLPLALLLLFDYLARNRRFSQSAAQVVSGLRGDPFYVRHAANAKTRSKQTRKFSCSSIKEYVKRLRQALKVAFDEAGLKLDPFAVLVSLPTEGNEVRYQMKAIVEWVHVDQ